MASKQCHMSNQRTYNSEGEKIYAPYLDGLTPPARKALLKAIEKDPWFDYIFRGGKLPDYYHLVLRLQVQHVQLKDGTTHLLYNGHLFGRHDWSWRPPKIIRDGGRQAQEYPNPRNKHPYVRYYDEDLQQIITTDKCPGCKSSLEYDKNMELYCVQCGLIY